jgi:uncharacterized protein (TIGR02145 family)
LNTTQPVDVTLYYSHNKRDWLIAPTVTGNLTAQTTGIGKTIIWDNSADNVRFGKFYFKVEVKQAEPCTDGVIINGVCWAMHNVGEPGTFVKNPEDKGMLYQWNRNIGWSVTDPMINSNDGTTWDSSASTGATWEKANDPSPAGWRVPTIEELRTLLDTDKVSNEWTTNGRKFTDKATGNSIFLPAAGCRSDKGGTLYFSTGSDGYYWSSSQSAGPTYAYFLSFRSGYTVWDNLSRGQGYSIRPVAE